MKVAFVYPGQGSQVVGMGRQLCETHAEAREVFEEADAAFAAPLTRLMFEGPDDEFRQTANTQPALVAMGIACDRILRAYGVEPDVVAGHSVGEYAALVSAGVMQLRDAIRLTKLRGQLMEEACPDGLGGMAAIIGFGEAEISALCREVKDIGVAEIAAMNGPSQVVLAGHIRALTECMALAKARGALSATMLHVSGPFHSSLMSGAAAGLSRSLQDTPFEEASRPIVTNVDAAFHKAPKELRENLIVQLTQPVLWEKSVKAMVSAGVEVFVELGPGRVLSGLIRRIEPTVGTVNVRDEASLRKTLDYLRANGYLNDESAEALAEAS